MNIGLVIVGDEILSGRRVDKHLPTLIELLKSRGLTLSWMRVVSDDPALLVKTYQDTFASGDIVFSTGGIGGTPDDMTRQAAGKALGIELQYHPEGLEILEVFAKERNRTLEGHHYRMVEFPVGSQLIPNPINRIPGFFLRNHFFMPGFPEMAAPMMEWVLDNHCSHLVDNQYVEQALMVFDTYESKVTPIMEAVLTAHPSLKLFSLPIMSEDNPRIELGVKGHLTEVKLAMVLLKEKLQAIDARWERL
ncbi:competence/damage-inducible protein A [Marinibactrum halimedae]|uniref:Damage-inducible protein n=1 Tax=Marinibactrum halimedae TaxID=1444977 RepID=A0AA37TA64_9GAMM|nr:molybdopterin-binding protein [Marinibactrum halimedae]MCD9457940.1 hypothetical protein [Marinibactrum halimedae]GLS26230.1 damage-inducible protein [Marinibactrum halimedae]